MIKREHNNLVYYTFRLFESLPFMSNVISTRLGGVSKGPYYSLNVASTIGDDKNAVMINRSRLYAAVGIEAETVAIAQLIHGTHIEVVTSRSQGATVVTGTDGLVTNVSNRALMITMADCAAVLFFDPKHRVIALAHAGWRGTAGRIVQKMVLTMNQVFECNPADILVGIGPSIGPCCYQVKQDVIDAFHLAFSQRATHYFVQTEDDTIHLDIRTAIRYQLLESGIRPEHLESSDFCTACHKDEFFSYRAEGKTGRCAGIIVLH